MVIDTSVLVAIVFGETEADAFKVVLRSAPPGSLSLSAVSAVEAAMVVHARQGADAARDLEALITALSIRIEPVDTVQATSAMEAWRRFGKGRHPAGLNLGDLFSYALAQTTGKPLLFKGEDFSRTDVRSALT